MFNKEFIKDIAIKLFAFILIILLWTVEGELNTETIILMAIFAVAIFMMPKKESDEEIAKKEEIQKIIKKNKDYLGKIKNDAEADSRKLKDRLKHKKLNEE